MLEQCGSIAKFRLIARAFGMVGPPHQIYYLVKISFYRTITLPEIIDSAVKTINHLGSLVSRNKIEGSVNFGFISCQLQTIFTIKLFSAN